MSNIKVTNKIIQIIRTIKTDKIIMISLSNMMEDSRIIRKREISKRKINNKMSKERKVKKKKINLNSKMDQMKINKKLKTLLKKRKRRKSLILFPIQISNGL